MPETDSEVEADEEAAGSSGSALRRSPRLASQALAADSSSSLEGDSEEEWQPSRSERPAPVRHYVVSQVGLWFWIKVAYTIKLLMTAIECVTYCKYRLTL